MTYAELKAACERYMHRKDLTQDILLAIELTGDRIVADIEIPDLEAVATLTPVAGVVALPADYQKGLRCTINSQDLAFVSAKVIGPWTEITGAPAFWSVNGSQLLIGPTSTASADALFTYQRKRTAMVDDADQDEALAWTPNAYLRGALYELHTLVQDYEKSAAMMDEYQAEILRAGALNSEWTTGTAPQIGVM